MSTDCHQIWQEGRHVNACCCSGDDGANYSGL